MGSIVTTKHKEDHGEKEAAVVVCSYTSVNPGKQTSTSTNSQRDTLNEHHCLPSLIQRYRIPSLYIISIEVCKYRVFDYIRLYSLKTRHTTTVTELFNTCIQLLLAFFSLRNNTMIWQPSRNNNCNIFGTSQSTSLAQCRKKYIGHIFTGN